MKVGWEGRYCLDAHDPLCIALTGNTECLDHVLHLMQHQQLRSTLGLNKCQSLLEQLCWLGKALVSSFFHFFFSSCNAVVLTMSFGTAKGLCSLVSRP